jgi:hypothetical protein
MDFQDVGGGKPETCAIMLGMEGDSSLLIRFFADLRGTVST